VFSCVFLCQPSSQRKMAVKRGLRSIGRTDTAAPDFELDSSHSPAAASWARVQQSLESRTHDSVFGETNETEPDGRVDQFTAITHAQLPMKIAAHGMNRKLRTL